MKRKSLGLITLLLVGLMLFPIIAEASDTYYSVTETVLREEASDTARKTVVIEEGQPLELLEKNGDWLKVSVNGKVGYIRSSLLFSEEDFIKSTVFIAEKDDNDNQELSQRTVKQEVPTEEKEEEYLEISSEDEILRVMPTSPLDSIQGDDKIDYEHRLGTRNYELEYLNGTLDYYVREQLINGRVTRYDSSVGDWVPLSYDNPEHRSYVKYYMDPKNFIDDPIRRLMFMKLSYQDVSAEDLNSMLVNKGVLTGKGEVFREAAKNANIHPVYLVAHALLETGNGTSKLATGKMLANDKPTYNIFGVGAYDSNPNFYGAAHAYNKGWFTVDDAILGGASFVSGSYINHPVYNQDTLYSMRYRFYEPDKWHQYATDARWAHSQSLTIYNDLKKVPPMDIHFKIPVFMEP